MKTAGRPFRGELFTASYSFAAIALIKLASSVITTRILYPEAYGIVGMVASVAFVVEMLSDLGAMTLMVRHERAEEPAYINTLWTLRLIRGVINATLLVLAAPWLADFYDTPALEPALRLFAIYFVFDGLESMTFMLAIRRQNSRLVNLCELFCVVVTTASSIGLALLLRNHWAIVLGMLLHKLMMAMLSHCFYREHRPRLQIDREAMAELFKISKFMMPSSVVTLLTTQYDRSVFLKLFDLRLLGLYSVAQNIIQIVDSRLHRLNRTVLFPRCADAFRQRRESLCDVYYRGNLRFHALTLAVPACLAGVAPLLVALAFDARYQYAGTILQLLALRSVLVALGSSSEALLLAVGHIHIGLVGNVARLAWLVPASLLGYHLGGFEGFVYGVVSEPLAALAIYLGAQARDGLLRGRLEALRVAYAAGVFGAAELFAAGVRHLLSPAG